jgi:hypothetical protein
VACALIFTHQVSTLSFPRAPEKPISNDMIKFSEKKILRLKNRNIPLGPVVLHGVTVSTTN